MRRSAIINPLRSEQRVRQYNNLRTGRKLIAHVNHIFNDLRKLRMHRGFSVTGKRDRIMNNSICFHLNQSFAKRKRQLFTISKLCLRVLLFCPAAFAINAFEIAQLAIRWKQINSQRNAEASAFHRTENKLIEEHQDVCCSKLRSGVCGWNDEYHGINSTRKGRKIQITTN
jgi:hypothetical protein